MTEICGKCAYYGHTRANDQVCMKTGKPVGFLHAKPCFTEKQIQMEENTKPQTKTCKGCGRELPVENFGRHPKAKDGLQPYCKECKSKLGKAVGGKRKAAASATDVGTPIEIPEETPAVAAPEEPPVQPLWSIPIEALRDELRRRGFEGTLTRTEIIEI